MIGIIIGNVDGILTWLHIRTELCSLHSFFGGSNDGNLEGLFIGVSLKCTDTKVLGSDEGIKLGLSDCKVIGTLLGDVDRIILGLDV